MPLSTPVQPGKDLLPTRHLINIIQSRIPHIIDQQVPSLSSVDKRNSYIKMFINDLLMRVIVCLNVPDIIFNKIYWLQIAF